MSENINTIYNYLVVADSSINTASTLSNTSINFGSNLLTTPLNTIIDNNGINTPSGNIGFSEVLIIRDATQALALPIPNDGLTLKVVDNIEIANQENPIGATKTNYGYNSITSSTGLLINGVVSFSSPPILDGSAISTSSILDTSLSNNVPLKDTTNIFSNNNTFNNIINGSISGNSVTSTNSTNVQTQSAFDNGIYALLMSSSTSPIIESPYSTNTLKYNPVSQNLSILDGSVTANQFNGIATSSLISNLSNQGFQQLNTDGGSYQLYFGDNIGGNSSFLGNPGLNYTPSLNALSCTSFTGNINSNTIRSSEDQPLNLLTFSTTQPPVLNANSGMMIGWNESGNGESIIRNYGQSVNGGITFKTQSTTLASLDLLRLTRNGATFNQAVSAPTFTGNLIGNSSSTSSAPDSALTANVPLKNTINIFTQENTFNNLITNNKCVFSNPLNNISMNSNNSTINFITNGSHNIVMGNDSGLLITTGNSNILMGRNNGTSLITGAGNVSIGIAAYAGQNDNSSNVSIGTQSARNYLSTNNFNVAIGNKAAFNGTGNTGIGLGASNCCFIGANTTTNSDIITYNRSVCIGESTQITASNQITLGTATENTRILGSLNVSGTITGTTTTSNNILITSDNSAGSYFIPFSKTSASASNALYIDDTTGPLTYNPNLGLLTVPQIRSNNVIVGSQTPINASTLNFSLGTLIIDSGTVAIAYTLPLLIVSDTGVHFTVQKTSSTNHIITINAAIGNQIAAVGGNTLNASFAMTNTIYQQSFRFINPNWYPY